MKNSILGGIFGLCVGDALGVPVEFVHRSVLDRDPVRGMRAGGTHNQPAGTWSDDTSMALCLLDSLAQGLDYGDIMIRFLRWYREGAYTPHGQTFDVGGATARSLERFARGTPPLACGGTQEGDNGNGSLMRILPLLFYLQSRQDMEDMGGVLAVVHDVSALTHAHKRSQLACGLYISVADLLTRGWAKEAAVERGLARALNWYRQSPPFARELAYYRRLSDPGFAGLSRAAIQSSGYVVHTLEAALWCLLTTKSYRDCVLAAVNLGDDTDTVAAVAGGLAGLHYGYENIPGEWLAAIVHREEIESLCCKLGDALG
jgi:ADP-ribosylglycohydrolase